MKESKTQTEELMKKTNELQNEGTRLTMQKQLSEKMRERLTLTNKVRKVILQRIELRFLYF